MENGCAGKIKKKKKEAEDMEQELLQEIASYWGTRAEGYSEVNEKELAGSQREAWLHVCLWTCNHAQPLLEAL